MTDLMSLGLVTGGILQSFDDIVFHDFSCSLEFWLWWCHVCRSPLILIRLLSSKSYFPLLLIHSPWLSPATSYRYTCSMLLAPSCGINLKFVCIPLMHQDGCWKLRFSFPEGGTLKIVGQFLSRPQTLSIFCTCPCPLEFTSTAHWGVCTKAVPSYHLHFQEI